MEQPSDLSPQEIRQQVEAAVSAQIAPLRLYMATIASTLSDIVDRLDHAEPGDARAGRGRALGPAPVGPSGPDLTPALLAIAEGIRASHDAVLGVDDRLGVGLLAFEARVIPSIEHLVGERLAEALKATKTNDDAVRATLQAVASLQERVRENLELATKDMEHNVQGMLTREMAHGVESRTSADKELQSSLHSGLAKIASGLETPAADIRGAARLVIEATGQMTTEVRALGAQLREAPVMEGTATNITDLARTVTALTIAVRQMCGSMDEAFARQQAALAKIRQALGPKFDQLAISDPASHQDT